MKHNDVPNNPIRLALDDELSFLDERPSLHYPVMQKIKGERVVKRKISVALVFTMVLLLLSAAALAFGLSQQFFTDVARMQFESGYYDDWNLSQKQAFVQIMLENGLLDEAKAAALKDEGAIDKYMIERYGIAGRSDTIGLYAIFETELGPMQDWDQERWAWYCDLMVTTGLMKAGGDQYYHYMPGSEAISKEEAISRAAAYLEADHSLPAGSLDQTTAMWHYFTDAADMETKKYGRHYVSFDGYEIMLHPDGERWTEEDEKLTSPYDWDIRNIISAYGRKHNLPVGLANYPVEHVAACIEQLMPTLEANLASMPEYRDPLGLWLASHTYGLPDEKALPCQEAITLAYSMIPAEHSAHIESFSTLYETTNPDAPLWKISGRDNTCDPEMTYRVFINAYTGEVTETYSYESYATATAEEVVRNTF